MTEVDKKEKDLDNNKDNIIVFEIELTPDDVKLLEALTVVFPSKYTSPQDYIEKSVKEDIKYLKEKIEEAKDFI